MHFVALVVAVLAAGRSARAGTIPMGSSVSEALSIESGGKVVQQVACNIPNQNDKGQCVVVSECESYLRLRGDLNITAEEVNFLKRVQCDDEGMQPRICCPVGTGGYVDPHVEFLRSDRKVKDEEEAIPAAKEQQKPTGSSNESFSYSLEEECGKQLVNRIYGGEIAELDEYPWMALLVYNSSSHFNPFRTPVQNLALTSPVLDEFGCAGALINRRYVLTAAHCVSGQIYEEKKGLKSVRLGEYNTNTEPDCIQEIRHLNCADSAVDVQVETIIIHPEYNEGSRDMQHDIALLRLKRDVRFTHFIMPICLPTRNTSMANRRGTVFTVAGWGRTNLFNKFRWNMASPIKLKLRVPIVDREHCSEVLQPHGVHLGPKQICAGGESSKDTCLGDSGGPLMRFDENMLRWVTHGVVSYGFTQCGVKGYPAVYTNVAEYIGWISSVIKK